MIRQALIMAAGAGMRLRPLTDTRPKPLLEVAGRPILDWSLAHLPVSIEEVVIVIGYRKDDIMSRYGSAWGGKKIVYVEQKELRGTGHAVHIAKPYLDEYFLVINGDDLYDQDDLTRLTAFPRAMMGKEVIDQNRFHSLQIDPRGKLVDFLEPTNAVPPVIVNVGAYMIDHHFFSVPLVPILNGAEFGLPHTLASMASQYPIDVVLATFWIPIGVPHDLEIAHAVLTERYAHR